MLKENKIVAARFTQKDVRLLKEVCLARGEDISDFIRRAVRKEFARMSYLSNSEKKALEVKQKENRRI